LQLLGAARRQLAAQERFDFPWLRIEQFRQDLGIVTLPRRSGLQAVNILGKDIVDHIRPHWFLADLVCFLKRACQIKFELQRGREFFAKSC
jgi:hypothetical protein